MFIKGAPTSITNFFAVVPKAVGLAVIIRFMDLPFKNILEEWQIIIIFISIASMILGSVAAIGQKNIKRLLALQLNKSYGLCLSWRSYRNSIRIHFNNYLYINLYNYEYGSICLFIFNESK